MFRLISLFWISVYQDQQQGQEMQQDETHTRPGTPIPMCTKPGTSTGTLAINVAALHQGPNQHDIEEIETACL